MRYRAWLHTPEGEIPRDFETTDPHATPRDAIRMAQDIAAHEGLRLYRVDEILWDQPIAVVWHEKTRRDTK